MPSRYRVPAAIAFATSVSTSSRLSHDKHSSASVACVASTMGLAVKLPKKGLVSSIAKMLSPSTRQAPTSLLNFGSKDRPSDSKKARDLGSDLSVGEFDHVLHKQRIRSLNSIPTFKALTELVNALEAARSQPQLALLVLHEDISTLGASQLESYVEQRHQNFIEYAHRVQLAGSLQKQNQLFQIRGLVRDVHHGDLAQELAGGVGSAVLRIENHIRDFTNAELQTVITLQKLAFDPLAIDERPMLAALINHTERTVLGYDQRVVP